MGIKYMCDQCEKNEGTCQVENGDWYCLNCYTGYCDSVYEHNKENFHEKPL